MKLIYLFRKIDELIKNYSVIIEIFLLNYNKYYKGKYKNDIEYNIQQMNQMNNLLMYINIFLQKNKKVDNVKFYNFIIIFNNFDVNKYNLNDIKSHFYYHIDIKIYKLCIEYYYYFKDLLLGIKNFCNKIQIVRNEIKENGILSSSSSLSDNFLTHVLKKSAIQKYSKSYNKEDIIKEIKNAFIKNNKIIEENKEELLKYNIYFFELTIENIEVFLNSQTEDKLKIIKLNIITKYELIEEIIILFLLNFVKIDYTKIIKIRKELIILDKYLNEETTYDNFFKSKDEIRELLGTIDIKTIINYKRIIINNFSFKNIYSGIKKEEIIDEIINSLFDIRLNEIFNNIKNKISFNYKKKSNSIEENDIIIQIIDKVYLIKDKNNKITDIKTIILLYYNKLDNNNDEELISILISEIDKIYNNKIIVDIRIALNEKGIYILEKYLNENNYYILLKSIDEIRNILRIQENKILNNIKKIISLYKNDNEKINKFLYSFDIINLYNKNKIYYIINEDNYIINEIIKSNLKNKELILDKIRYISYTSNGDDIEYDITKIRIELNKYLEEINNNLKNIDDIKDLVKIYEIYDNIISKNFTDTKIKEYIKEIKKYNKFGIYNNIIIKRFKEINEYYKFDYDITELEDIYIYKNYIYVIRDLYIFLLLIKDNFNLLYTTIEKIKKTIELYKKINHDPMILFAKLNQVNDDKNTGVFFNNFDEIEIFLNKFMKI